MLWLATPAYAISFSLQRSETVASGVVVETWRSSSPATDIYVARIDLCASGVVVDASRAADSPRSTADWAEDAGVVLATNGDFYKTDPLRVYGDAVGGGVRWPTEQTGLDAAYDGEWYDRHYGWIAFLHDGVQWTHTGWVKANAADFGTLGGWATTDLEPDPPPGTLALVSGFPELVVEGVAMTCGDPEASTCFPDRSDMRDRHPRTAMGLTEDLETFLLVVADGRTSNNSGLYGSELAALMDHLGAWVAFNLDGGGSSQLWADGYVNDYDGNNSGSGERSVADHWGVFAGAVSYLPDRPGHCASAPVCETLAATGGTLDNEGACFRGFGDQTYWRHTDGGVDGRLQWTNAFESETPDNWAWWRLELAEAGTYRVEVSSDATWSVNPSVRYQVRAAGATAEVRVDPRGGGWHPLGEFTFAAGGEQWVAVFDHEPGGVASDQHIVADAVRLVRLDGGDTGDTGATGEVDTGEPDTADTAAPDSSDTAGQPDDTADGGDPGQAVAFADVDPGGCGCDAARADATALALVGAWAAGRRRRSGRGAGPARGGTRSQGD